jgi:hypothetical protein
MVYNVHNLLHLYEFVKLYGNVNNFSTFPFENFLSTVKLRCKKTRYVFPHIVHQLLSIRDVNVTNPEKPLHYTIKPPNNVCMCNNKVILITSVSYDNSIPYVSGTILKFSKPLYDYPLSSSDLYIGYYNVSLQKVKLIKPTNKCISIPVLNQFLIIPYCL